MPDQNNPTDTNLNPSQVNPPSEPTQMPAAPPPFPPETSPIEGTPPPFDIPPVVTPVGKPKKFGGKKVIATILGLLVLVGGLGAGVILVKQQQDIREKAAVFCTKDCVPQSECKSGTQVGGVGYGDCGAGEYCCDKSAPPTPAPQFCTKDCVPQSECKSGTQVGGVGYGDCGAGEYCCEKVPTPTQPPSLCPYDCVPLSKCKAGGQNLGLGYGDCGAALGEYCCETAASPAPISCTIIPRDPASQGYCDRSAPNTPNCTDKVEGSSCNIRAECGGGTGTCVVINQGGANSECQCQKGVTPPPTKTPTPPPSPPGGTPSPPPTKPPTPGSTPTPPPTAQCLNIQAFDTSWNKLSSTDLSNLKPGDKVRFTVAGQASSGNFDKARFIVNSLQRPEVTQKRPGTDEFFDEYTIAGGITRFTINAQIHHETLGWSMGIR